jgi:hypothetical protein
MAHKENVIRSYLLHQTTGQARVRIDGRDHLLGRFGTPDAQAQYDTLITE